MKSEFLLKTLEEYGELEFSTADDANIPVSIFLSEIEDDDENENANHKWKLTADNYMPRKGRASDTAYEATAPTREALVEVIKKYILPLYQTAIANLNAMIEGTNGSLYYCSEPKDDSQE